MRRLTQLQNLKIQLRQVKETNQELTRENKRLAPENKRLTERNEILAAQASALATLVKEMTIASTIDDKQAAMRRSIAFLHENPGLTRDTRDLLGMATVFDLGDDWRIEAKDSAAGRRWIATKVGFILTRDGKAVLPEPEPSRAFIRITRFDTLTEAIAAVRAAQIKEQHAS